MFKLISFVPGVSIHVITELQWSSKSVLFILKFTFFSVDTSRTSQCHESTPKKTALNKVIPALQWHTFVPSCGTSSDCKQCGCKLVLQVNAVFDNFPWPQCFWDHRWRKWWESQSSESSAESHKPEDTFSGELCMLLQSGWADRHRVTPWLRTKGHCRQLWPKRVDRQEEMHDGSVKECWPTSW